MNMVLALPIEGQRWVAALPTAQGPKLGQANKLLGPDLGRSGRSGLLMTVVAQCHTRWRDPPLRREICLPEWLVLLMPRRCLLLVGVP